MSDTSNQLKEIESALAEQEADLVAQLETLTAKRDGLRTVIEMFNSEGDAQSEASAPKTTRTKQKQPATKKASDRKTTAKKQKAKGKKKDGRSAAWQKYVRPGVKNESIPDAVKLILSTQPTKEFKIADVMSALFEDDMPRAQYLKARNRVSNVLSGGVRSGDWHRGGRSSYLLEKAS